MHVVVCILCCPTYLPCQPETMSLAGLYQGKRIIARSFALGALGIRGSKIRPHKPKSAEKPRQLSLRELRHMKVRLDVLFWWLCVTG